ncbi:MAG: hypothetical protein QXH03_03425 [Candidatus Bathyarchaeia archaeon]
MDITKRSLVIFGLGWLTSLVLIGCIAGYYYVEYQNLLKRFEEYKRQPLFMRVNICINYAEWNGTSVWYNNTFVPLGCSLLNATQMVAVVSFTYWESYDASFVDAINNIANSGGRYWMWYRWTGSRWEYGHVGADKYVLSPEETVMWRYETPHYP